MLTEEIAQVHDLRHRPTEDPAYNESTYYNFATPDGAVVGWVRLAFQANRPAAQASVLLFLEGETIFGHSDVQDASGDVFEAAGLTFDIVDPHRVQRLRYAGSLSSFVDARVLVNAGEAFRSAPRKDVRLDLAVASRGVPFGTNGEDPDQLIESTMALGHYEQFIDVDGELELDGRVTPLRGAGMRDHSWGPRDWQGPLWYRWITATLDDGTSIMLLQVARRDGTVRGDGVIGKEGALTAGEFTDIEVDWTPDGFVRVTTAVVRTAAGEFTLRAEVQDETSFIPLKHRRLDEDGRMLSTRIGYAPYVFTTSDGRTGRGIVEALDQLEDGLPVGMRARASHG